MERIECVANYNKRNKIDAKFKNPACVINCCCDKVVMLPMPLKIQVTLCLSVNGESILTENYIASDFDW